MLNFFSQGKPDEFQVAESFQSTLLDHHTVSEEDVRFILGLTDTQPRSYFNLTKEAIDSVEGLGKAIDFMYELSKQDKLLTEENIKEMHGFVRNYNPYHASDYRSVPIRMPETGEPALPFNEIEKEMAEALAKYNTDVNNGDALEAVARFHYSFEYIHPFFEDNGKVGRLLVNLGLIRHGYHPITIQDIDKDAYQQAFISENPEEALVSLFKTYLKK